MTQTLQCSNHGEAAVCRECGQCCLCCACCIELDLDPAIFDSVKFLRTRAVKTFESCQGGKGHAYHEPTICFNGDEAEGLRVLYLAIEAGMPVQEVHRVWPHCHNCVTSGEEPHKTYWRLILFRGAIRFTLHYSYGLEAQNELLKATVERLQREIEESKTATVTLV